MIQSFYYSVILQFTQLNLAGMGMGTDEDGDKCDGDRWGCGQMGMGTNTMGTVGDGDNWKLRGWGQLGVPMSLFSLLCN